MVDAVISGDGDLCSVGIHQHETDVEAFDGSKNAAVEGVDADSGSSSRDERSRVALEASRMRGGLNTVATIPASDPRIVQSSIQRSKREMGFSFVIARRAPFIGDVRRGSIAVRRRLSRFPAVCSLMTLVPAPFRMVLNRQHRRNVGSSRSARRTAGLTRSGGDPGPSMKFVEDALSNAYGEFPAASRVVRSLALCFPGMTIAASNSLIKGL